MNKNTNDNLIQSDAEDYWDKLLFLRLKPINYLNQQPATLEEHNHGEEKFSCETKKRAHEHNAMVTSSDHESTKRRHTNSHDEEDHDTSVS
ncbi:hypothetical protein ACA910_018245 [Epithemia clementina (nom. ined.)]